METLSVVFVNWRDKEHPSAGGAEVYTHEIASRLVGRGHEVTLFTSSFPGAKAEAYQEGVRIVRGGNWLTVYWKAARFLRGVQCDVVVDEINTRPFFAFRYARTDRVVALIHQLAREYWFRETPLPIALVGRYLLEDAWLSRYHQIPTVTVSKSTRQDLLDLGFKQVVVVPNGVDIPAFPLPPEEEEPVLLFLGRLTRAKRPMDALEAYRLLRPAFPAARLWIAGGGPEEIHLRRRTQDLENGVTLWGRISERQKWNLLSRASLLLVPGTREGWGRVVLEANAVGTPAVTYDIPGLRDAVRHGETGLLTSSNHPKALAEGASCLLSETELRMSLGENAKRWARQFDWQRSVRIFEEVLKHA